MRRRQPEQDILKAVIEHLRVRGASGIFFTHFPAGGYRASAEARIFSGFVAPGVPDLLIWCDGRCYALELKVDAKGAHLSPSQIETQRLMKAAGVIISTAYGIDEAIMTLEEWGLLRGVAQTGGFHVGQGHDRRRQGGLEEYQKNEHV
jgi:hypothetical protein